MVSLVGVRVRVRVRVRFRVRVRVRAGVRVRVRADKPDVRPASDSHARWVKHVFGGQVGQAFIDLPLPLPEPLFRLVRPSSTSIGTVLRKRKVARCA